MTTLIVLWISVVLQVQVDSARLQELTERPTIVPMEQLRSGDHGHIVNVFRLTPAKHTEVTPYHAKDDYLPHLKETMEKLGISGLLRQVEEHMSGPTPREMVIIIVEEATEDTVTFALPTRGPLYCVQRKGEWFLYPRGYPRSASRSASFCKSEGKLVLEVKNAEERFTATTTIPWDEITSRSSEPVESKQ